LNPCWSATKAVRLDATASYGSAKNLVWLVGQKQITPLRIPVVDKSTRTDGTFSRADFTLDAAPNETLS
jgi:hypothetical protein